MRFIKESDVFSPYKLSTIYLEIIKGIVMITQLTNHYTDSLKSKDYQSHFFVRSNFSEILNSQTALFSETINAVTNLPVFRSPLPKPWHLPPLFESVMATYILRQQYTDILHRIVPHARAVLQIGSLNWGRNFWLSNNLVKSSDLDVEIIIDEIIPEDFKEFPRAEEGLTLFKEMYEKGAADYFSHTLNNGGKKTSLHFMPHSVFQRNCAIDVNELDQNIINRELRIIPKSTPPIYRERFDSLGKHFTYESNPQQINGGIITDVPVMMISPEDNIVMGLVMSKYFTYPHVSGDQTLFDQGIIRFKKNLAQRVKKEGGRFSEMPGRKSKMPKHLLDKLDDEQEILSILNSLEIQSA